MNAFLYPLIINWITRKSIRLQCELKTLSYIINEAGLEKIDLLVDLSIGNKSFTAYTMDLTKKYIEINADYRT